ncbi:unnamed protein product [Paramecium sonneborni]|uniref:Uncharacterized protein n=1 Tax=Paramecium sonneborni TaxID=65129 RepID=A0A8S1P6K8_9CILI|nr:unnamed protein product [Paramecium sonneborni]
MCSMRLEQCLKKSQFSYNAYKIGENELSIDQYQPHLFQIKRMSQRKQDYLNVK